MFVDGVVPVSHHFGYGLLDVAVMVEVARNWTRVPEQHRCEITSRHASRLAAATNYTSLINVIVVTCIIRRMVAPFTCYVVY